MNSINRSQFYKGQCIFGTVVAIFRKRVPQPLSFGILLMCLTGCGLISDSKLEQKFRSHSADFDQLVKMFEEDQRIVIIRPNLTTLDNDSSWPRKDIGISVERWNQYRKLFKELGLSQGLERRNDYSAILLVADGSGPVTASSYKGYAYSERPVSPSLNSLDAKWLPPSVYDKKGHAIVFKPIAKNWYLYREQY
jgi:hypothetical protein